MTDEDPRDLERLGKIWHDRISAAKQKASKYLDRCDKVDKAYGMIEGRAEAAGDREFQMFWANIEVLRPIVYSRPPRPVVQPRYQKRDQTARKASEILERVLEADAEADNLHETLKLVRDDMTICARGVPWVLDNAQCIFVDRRDFLHGPARHWGEVTWVARGAYLTKEEGVEAFGDVFRTAKTQEHDDRSDDKIHDERKALVWEIWDKDEGQVIHITEGVRAALSVNDPFIDVKGFFPCAKPAYATLQRGTLTPIPDLVFYEDQIDEINELTDRIAALSESLRLKGFYPSGNADLSDAIETAMRSSDNKAILVPVAAMAAFGNTAAKDSIVWLPVAEVAGVITSLVGLRQQLIADVYEITGISDIMRGQTDSQETARAQSLKAQYGAVRVREKQQEMVRVARDIMEIKAEIYAEQYPIEDLLSMSQVTDLPSMADIQQMDPAQEMPVTVEAVDQLLKGHRIRPFVLDVETDSTIQPDEQAEKENRMELLSAIGSFIQQSAPVIAQEPATGPFFAELLKFTASGFRAERELGGVIDQFAAQIEEKAAQAMQSQGPSPEEIEAQAKAMREQQKGELEVAEFQLKAQDAARKADRDDKRLLFDIASKGKELGLKADEGQLAELQAELDAMFKLEELEVERDQSRPVAIGND